MPYILLMEQFMEIYMLLIAMFLKQLYILVVVPVYTMRRHFRLKLPVNRCMCAQVLTLTDLIQPHDM